MPIWLRKYTFNEIKAFYDEENKQIEKAQNPNKNSVVDSDGKVNIPEFLKNSNMPPVSTPSPSYVTKASKK